MKKLQYILTLIGLWLVFSAFIGITEDVTAALKAGNAFKISALFKGQVDITVLEESDLLSKLEAEKLLFDFFHENDPSDFVILHQGKSRTGQEYIIGTLTTNNGNYRISIYVKKTETSEFIQQFIIEAE
jgi:hypothetical protein